MRDNSGWDQCVASGYGEEGRIQGVLQELEFIGLGRMDVGCGRKQWIANLRFLAKANG